jgi:molybdenum cofactor biosynthesis enzyme
MCKSVAKDISIESTRLLEKQGGKSDYTLNDNKE